MPSMYVNADAVNADDSSWIASKWEEARLKMGFAKSPEFLLVIDEVHKIDNWSELVKKEWDADTFNDVNIKVVLLGSSRLLLKYGLTESLAGRFELLPMSHWSFKEMREAFGFDIDQYIYYGGYPGSATYLPNESRWRRYMSDAIVDPAIEKDVLLTTHIYKPALMRQLFRLGCSFSSELLSYNKMIGMLQDAGNSTTLADYMKVLGESKLLTGLQKFDKGKLKRYNSIPKLQVFNNALLTVMTNDMTFQKARTDPRLWGRWVESAVGCYLLEKADELNYELFYWKNGDAEVDYIITRGDSIIAIEVKSGHRQTNKGLKLFKELFNPKYSIVVGGSSMPLDEFYSGDLSQLL